MIKVFTILHVNLKNYSHEFLYYYHSDDQEILDENPMKVGSELISMSVDPQLPNRLRVPVTISLKNTNVCSFLNGFITILLKRIELRMSLVFRH